MITILGIDLGKFKSVCCVYDVATGTARFETRMTQVAELRDLIQSERPEQSGKLLSGRTKPCANRAAAALRLAACGLHRSQTALGAYLRRMKARLGAPKAITATAHKLARMVYFTLKYG